MDDARRPDPEELLARAAREERLAKRGKLKIYFGAAPGVGKTFAMLEGAQARRRHGLDVVVGWMETHGRRETEDLARDLERLAPRQVDYRGVKLSEFDLDGALARRPGLLLLDELAHTNAAGSRHARRWQDIEELLEAGLDVHTTLNVQHVESLNDIVEQIIGVRVRETVPDRVFDAADEVELVDLPPDELLSRLREGKVYVPLQAERAAQNFFRKENLLALRELALRRTAERVDAQTDEFRRAHGLAGIWSVRERVVAVLEARTDATNIVRAAYRVAARARAPWMALNVETPEVQRLAEPDRERLDEALELARRLGAEAAVVRGVDFVEEILAFARERRATHVLISRPTGSGWRRLARAWTLVRLARDAGAIDVLVTAGEAHDAAPARGVARPSVVVGRHFAYALAAVSASTALCWSVRSVTSLADHVMIYLLGVLVVASRLPRLPSLVAAIASVVALDFFFVPPYFRFAVADVQHVLSFVVMLAVGLIVSSYTVRLREQADAASQRERRTAALYAMSRQFVIETGVGEIASTAIRYIREIVDTETFILLADRSSNLSPCGGEGAWVAGDERELAAARLVHEHGRLAGYGTDTLPGSQCLYIPLVGSAGHLGVFGVALARRAAPLTAFQWQALETFVAQTALAIERALLVERTATAQVAVEAERARGELLSAVTHDVRTPLTAIHGSAQTLIATGGELAPERRLELLEVIRDESERLSRLVSDLLELTRIESGTLRVRKEPCPVDDVIDSAVERLESKLAGRTVTRAVPGEVLVAALDPVLFEHVLVNLIENATKYTPPETPIEVRAFEREGAVVFEVSDRGPGIAPAELERIFERFYRACDGDRGGGTGLGLTVSRAIVRAHDGRISAENRAGGGATFRVELPASGPLAQRASAERAR
ncbi:MAG: sensor histidine kinase KdpD [Planctomycetes bacterium]|nr:sensor histidine kinase KdpD [Planctomycetota bacterium]